MTLSGNMPQKFSVCMCVYEKDNPKWFSEAMNSILNQTCPPDEVVLVVDGPVSEELEYAIETFSKLDVIQEFKFAENVGHGVARNKAIELCRNDLIAIMDADDISTPNRFELLLQAFELDPNLSVVGGYIEEITDNEKCSVSVRRVYCSHADICKDIKTRCPFNQVSVMLRRSHIDRVGGYQDWYCNEDYFLWIRMYMAGMRFANVPCVLVKVRVGPDMYRRRGGWKYFSSEFRLQKYMKANKIIDWWTYSVNVGKRFAVQLLLTNGMRKWVYKKFARS